MAWTSPRTWNPGETVTAPLLNTHLRDNLNLLKTYFSDEGVPSGFLLTAYQTADVTKNSNTTFADLTGLSFNVLANENWMWFCLLRGVSNATADIKFTFTGPASPTAVMFGTIGGSGAPIVSANGAVTAFGTAVAPSSGAALDELYLLGGLLRNGANAGTVQAQMAQNTSTAVNTTVYTNSVLVALRLL